MEILSDIGSDGEHKLSLLDEKFWVWETLEEATKPTIDTLDQDKLVKVMVAFGSNYKGSDDLWDFLVNKHYLYTTKPF